MSAESPVVAIDRHSEDERIAILTLQKEPVNSMSLAFWEALQTAVEKVNGDETVRCIVFQSGLKKNVFTAGMDFQELYAPSTSQERLHKFWGTASKCLVAIYGSKKLTIAAIAGACPAGGCCLSLCCDARMITEDGSMGLNEVALGMPVPQYWIMRMKEVIGFRETERMLLQSLMPKAQELLKIGMVDLVVPLEKELAQTRAKLMSCAVAHAKNFCLDFPELGFVDTKMKMRKPLYDAWLIGGPTEEAEDVWQACKDERTVAALTKVMQSLQKKPKAKAKL